MTAAAELLHVAQPSMPQQIRNLERELGVGQLVDQSALPPIESVDGEGAVAENH
ncbi:LysR family transcriptional regulator [Nocardia sp. NPDC051570]|uniref:LysR family transcriptional regulator n=1 Tax=Nocardia sp. NPDC051570 TaxID=3364324 RepID=UPI00378B6C69